MNYWCEVVEACAGGVKWWYLELVVRWWRLELVVRCWSLELVVRGWRFELVVGCGGGLSWR